MEENEVGHSVTKEQPFTFKIGSIIRDTDFEILEFVKTKREAQLLSTVAMLATKLDQLIETLQQELQQGEVCSFTKLHCNVYY